MRKVIWIILIGILLFVAFETSDIELPLNKPAKLLFVGDIMLSRQIGKIMERENNYNFPFELILDYIQNADIAFGNLENPVSSRGVDQGSEYSFRADPESLAGLKWAGFDAVSLANNHILDWGYDALSDTLTHLKGAGIATAGIGDGYEEAHTPARLRAGGQNFCIFSYSEFAPRNVALDTPTVARLDEDTVVTDIQEIENSCDVIIVSLHWGNEYEIKPQIEQVELAHSFIDAGALLVVGHHPHVIQPIEKYKNGIIAYSLGNFVFDQNFSEDTSRGMILEVVIEDSKIIDYKETEIRFNSRFQPYVLGVVY